MHSCCKPFYILVPSLSSQRVTRYTCYEE